MHHSVCAPVCAQLQQEEWFIIMIINIYQFHLLPCISCWTWMSVKEDVYLRVCLLPRSEHWVWLYKLQFLYFYEVHFFFISAAWNWTNYIFESTSKGGKKKKKLMAHWSHFKQLPFCRCVCGSSSHVCTDRPATAAMAPSSQAKQPPPGFSAYTC